MKDAHAILLFEIPGCATLWIGNLTDEWESLSLAGTLTWGSGVGVGRISPNGLILCLFLILGAGDLSALMRFSDEEATKKSASLASERSVKGWG